VILFGGNGGDRAQWRRLTGSLQRAAGGRALVMVDQEGGDIRTVGYAGPPMSQPFQGPPRSVRHAANGAGRQLRAAGIQVNLAPVADLPRPGSVMATRSFAGDERGVAARTRGSVRGLRDASVAATVKHFPGLGGATVNTDDGPATIGRSRAELDADLAPFRAAIDAGTEFVMASHAAYPAVDDAHIASQSAAVVDGLLRDELGFGGVVMTDSLEAAAVRAVADVEEAAVASARAGVDVVLTTGRGSYIRVFRALLAEARSHPEFRRRVREAAARVLVAQSSGNG
jgi:beta-N-acetylhexosaminidase